MLTHTDMYSTRTTLTIAQSENFLVAGDMTNRLTGQLIFRGHQMDGIGLSLKIAHWTLRFV